jgi:hypothetical protein
VRIPQNGIRLHSQAVESEMVRVHDIRSSLHLDRGRYVSSLEAINSIGLALVSTLDAKFRPYDNEAVPLFDASQNQIGTFTFSGAFIWIHWNVFAVSPPFQ